MNQPVVNDDSHGLRQRRQLQDRSQQRHGLLAGKRYSRRSKLLLLALGFSWVLIFFLVLFFSVQIYLLRQENRDLLVALRDSETAREPLDEELTRLQSTMEDLLAGRLPGLTEISFDQVMSLEEGYLKNILFSRITQGDQVVYEYRLVLENPSFVRVWPQLSLYFFDEFGMQLGTVDIGPEVLRRNGNNSSLAPDESLSFSGFLEFSEARSPHYFRTRIGTRLAPEEGLTGEPEGVENRPTDTVR